MIFTFPQSYYIYQLLTVDHDCPVPVDKNSSVKTYSTPLTPLTGSKVKYLNFAITKAVVNTGRGAIDMKHIKRDFSLKVWVRSPGVDLGGGAEAKSKLFFRIWSCFISN